MLRAWRRGLLTRRLTKCQVNSGGDTADADAAACSVVELLDDHQLDILLTAVETGGYDNHINECILVNSSAHVAPHVLCCRLWRWPLLQNSGEIKRVPWCQCQNKHGNGVVLENSQAVCCHPYHWSRLLLPGDTLKMLACVSFEA